jgi:ABC-type transporter Mla MlaB component
VPISNGDASLQHPHQTVNSGDPAGLDTEAMRARKATPADTSVVDLDVSWLVRPDLAAVDALARLQLAAARCGRSLCLYGADRGLVELLEFVGLGQTLFVCPCAHPPTGDPDDGATTG